MSLSELLKQNKDEVESPAVQTMQDKEDNKKVVKYKNIRGRKVFNVNGIAVKEFDGILYPKNQNEIDECNYFVSLGYVEEL